MPQYHYKGFEISYYIVFNSELDNYEAHGTITREKPEHYVQEFETASISRKQVDEEIKKLMEQFISFEWEQAKLLSENTEIKPK